MNRSALVSILARVSLALTLSTCLGVAAVGLALPARAAAAITVSSCNETGLDAAIAQANSDNAGDTITFSCSGTIGLTSTLDITGSMTLDGTGQQVTLSGQGQAGVVSVASGVTFTMTNLTIAGGTSGGLINNGGTVNIASSTFRGNSNSYGGAVDNLGGAVNITGSTFGANHSTSGVGGALNNDHGTVSIASSYFVQNFAGITATDGGAIVNAGTMSITGSSFSDNNAARGGALYNEGVLDIMSITNSSFVQNHWRQRRYSSGRLRQGERGGEHPREWLHLLVSLQPR